MGFIIDWGVNILHKALLLLMQGIYWLGGLLYKLFLHLSTMQIFSDEFYSKFAQRIYAVLGVFMLFYLSYALLQALVDPDKFTGKEGARKIAMNLVTSLVLLGLFPTIFTYAYRVQNYIIGSNTIGAIILGTSVIDTDSNNENLMKTETGKSMLQYGDAMSFLIFNTFVNPENCNVNLSNGYSWFDMKKDIIENGEYSGIPSLGDAVSTGTDIIGSDNVTTCTKTGKQPLTFMALPALAAGCLFVYFMIGFVIDLGVRVFKMAYYQLVAPIPIIMRIIPSKKDVFQNWLKGVLQTYMEVFIRIATMYAVVFFISALAGESNVISDLMSQGVIGMLAIVVLIFGLLKIAKEIPKMISETLGFKNGGVDLGLKSKGPLGAAIAAAGAGIGGFALGNTVGRAAGFVTGGLGGAYDAMVNGANVLDGFTYGSRIGNQNGAKATNLKGLRDSLQFNKMRQQHFNKALGIKGNASILGGTNRIEQKNEKLQNDIQNRYNKSVSGNNQRFINEFESRPEFKEAIETRNRDRLNAISFVSGQYTFTENGQTYSVDRSQLQSFIDANQQKLMQKSNDFNNEVENERNRYAAHDQDYRDILNRLNTAKSTGNYDEVEKQREILNKYETDHKVFDAANTSAAYKAAAQDYNDFKSIFDKAHLELDEYNKQNSLATASDADILEDVRQEFKQKDPEYKKRTNQQLAEDNEKKDRRFMESDAGRQQKKMFDALAKQIIDGSKK